MHRLASLSLGNRALIALITVLTAVFGVLTTGSLKQELVPSLEFPQVTVVSTLQGASAEVMDKQVGQPLESALLAVEDLESSSAVSSDSVSRISLSFAYGTNLDRARNQVERAISNASGTLPEDASTSSFAGSISDFPVVYLAVAGRQDLNELSADVERLTVPALSKVEGVRGVDVSGAAGQRISITPDPDELAANGLTRDSLERAVEEAGLLVPLGTVREGSLALAAQAGGGPGSLEALRAVSLAGPSGVVLLGDVADVELVDNPATSITRTNGAQTLAVSITKTPDGDTVAISHAVNALIPHLESELGPEAEITVVFDQAPFIERSIHDLTVEGLLGLGFAVAVILVFLTSVRSTLVTAVSIPLSLLATFIGISAAGFSLNMLTLGALTISIGRVVDDSIVVIENIKRHLEYGGDRLGAIIAAVREVAAAVTAATLTTVAVFAPVAFVGGVAGELFRPFALTVTIALLASLLVSLTIVPVLAYWFLGRRRSAGPVDRERAQARELRSWLQRGYAPVLRATQRRPVATLLASVLVLAGTVAMVPLLQTNLLGSSGQNFFTVTQAMPASTSLAATSRAARPVEEALRGVDGVEAVQVSIGGGSFGRPGAADTASYTVVTASGTDQVAVQEAARAALAEAAPRGEVSVGGGRGGPMGASSTVDVQVKAPTPEALAEANDAVVAALRDIPDARAPESDLSGTAPRLEVEVDAQAAADRGLTQSQVALLAAAAIQPASSGSVRIGYTDYSVYIGKGRTLTSPARLRALELAAPAGPVRLGDVATVRTVEAQASISSSNGERIATVSVSPGENSLGAVSAEVGKRLEGLALPAGATASIGGAASEQADSFRQLYLALLAAVAIVYVIMVATFKSLVQPLVLLVSIPFAATGAVGLLLLTGVPLGLPALIGMLMLVGIVVTNAIVLIDLINQYRLPRGTEPAMPLEEAIFHGARQRLRPILMTALATVFALAPMALGLTGSGGFISQPLAIVVVGGLASSTLLTLVLVPVLYRLVEGAKERAALRRGRPRGPQGASAASPREGDPDLEGNPVGAGV
ncbi:multidrug transporter [Zafaria cholistanensis]|uniref:Multidrug transporter n=1 Tax=Zafaria cholistanensis TaxID=1682741 RepID=A0A5A7NQ20_9MICC|nr:efflux RND transporter permease subunit [Zafaria cholistanensis]GER21871.1 multidrug transporter [Zafaria cholistanensis]